MFSPHGSFLPTEPFLNTSYPVLFILATVILSYLLPLTQLQQLLKQKKMIEITALRLLLCGALVAFSALISCNLLNRSKETSSGICHCSASAVSAVILGILAILVPDGLSQDPLAQNLSLASANTAAILPSVCQGSLVLGFLLDLG